jgi:hypothetical protein
MKHFTSFVLVEHALAREFVGLGIKRLIVLKGLALGDLLFSERHSVVVVEIAAV